MFCFKVYSKSRNPIPVISANLGTDCSPIVCVPERTVDMENVSRFKYATRNIRGLGEEEEELERIWNEK